MELFKGLKKMDTPGKGGCFGNFGTFKAVKTISKYQY
jgi:hypothetical protein